MLFKAKGEKVCVPEAKQTTSNTASFEHRRSPCTPFAQIDGIISNEVISLCTFSGGAHSLGIVSRGDIDTIEPVSLYQFFVFQGSGHSFSGGGEKREKKGEVKVSVTATGCFCRNWGWDVSPHCGQF